MMASFKINDNRLLISFDHQLGTIDVDLHRLFEGMSNEDRQEMAKSITWEEIMQQAVDRLTGDSEFWSGGDSGTRLEFLAKTENALLTRYKWSALTKLLDKFMKVASHQHIYWKMYHEENEHLRRTFHRWFEINEIKSDYDRDLPTIEAFEVKVDDMFKELANKETPND